MSSELNSKRCFRWMKDSFSQQSQVWLELPVLGSGFGVYGLNSSLVVDAPSASKARFGSPFRVCLGFCVSRA